MDGIRWLARFLALPLAVAVCWTALGAASAQAGLVTTEEVVAKEVAAADRTRVKAYLARQDVQSQLRKLGIEAEEATARVDGLTDAEVQRIAAKLDQRPAGGDALGTLVGAGVFVFVVLLITDIAGATDVFPFVKK
ncbi:PA2779 family protein [Thiohalorhabdus sp.]|uniref:PA2779 family protein n=1 Tax=Thiohalorhabdus sp. TaxID=3094134 RepID=UPI002FC277E6